MLFKVLILSLLSGAFSLVAYDCNGPTVEKTSISLVQTPNCEIPAVNVTSENIMMAVTQSTSISEIDYYRCSIEAFHTVYRCGKSIDTWHDAGLYSEVYHITREECKQMVVSKYIDLRWGSSVRVTLRNEGETHFSYTSFGSIDKDGSCTNGGRLTGPNGESWERAVRLTRLHIKYIKGNARLFHDDGVLKFPNGVSCKLVDGTCQHSGYGQLYWDQPPIGCSSNKNSDSSLIFKGVGQLITDNDLKVKYVQVKQGEYDFQLKITKQDSSVCGFPSYSTEHPRLFMTLLPQGSPLFTLNQKVGAEDLNMANYINSKFIFAMRHVKGEVDRLFKVFLKERCKLANKITENMMTLALISPREFAYQYFKGPGYTAVSRGEVVHVAKCREVAVTLKLHDEHCFNEIPVSYKNETWYVSPRTRILVKVGTHVDCSTDLGSQFLIDDKWVTLTPLGAINVRKPSIITPEPLSYEFESLEDLGSNGLYTREMLIQYQKILTSPLEEQIIISRLSGTLSGKTTLPEGYSIVNSLSMTDIESIESRITSWTSVFGEKCRYIGEWFSFALFVIFCIKCISWVITSLCSYSNLRNEHGCFTSIFLCIIGDLSVYISDLLNRRKAKKESKRSNINEKDLSLKTIDPTITPLL